MCADKIKIDPSAIEEILIKTRLPPVHRWEPAYVGNVNIRVARDGTWFYNESPITRQPMVKLFSSVLRRESGHFYLVTPVEKLRIIVDDAPFVAVAMNVYGSGKEQVLTFRTNVDEEIMAGRSHPIRVDVNHRNNEPAPYIKVRHNLDALVSRAVFYDLVELAVEDETSRNCQFGVWSAGCLFPLGSYP